MNSNTGMDQFGTNNANTVLVPRRSVHDLESEFGKELLEYVRKHLTWKKAIIGTIGFVAGWVICYALIAAGLAL